jgi:hypothetical protein
MHTNSQTENLEGTGHWIIWLDIGCSGGLFKQGTDIRVPQWAGNFLISYATISFSRRTLPRGLTCQEERIMKKPSLNRDHIYDATYVLQLFDERSLNGRHRRAIVGVFPTILLKKHHTHRSHSATVTATVPWSY